MLLLEKRGIMKVGLVALLLLSSVSVNAHESQRGYTTKKTCHKESYREEYIAGTRESKGYVKSIFYKVEVPCTPLAKVHHHHRPITSYNYSRTRYYQPTTSYRVSRSNSSYSACRSSRATGGILGGGLAAAISKQDAWDWSIPLGAVIGLGVGHANC